MKLSILNRNFHFYLISTFRYKLVSHWIDFYLNNIHPDMKSRNIPLDNDYSFSFDESITGAFFLCFAIRGFYASISKDFQSMGYLKQLYFGSFFGIINAHPFHVETLFFIWSTNYLAVVFTVKFFQLKHFRWIEIINFLEGQIEARNIGLNKTDGKKLRRISKWLMTAVTMSIILITINMSIIMFYLFYLYMPFYEYLTMGFVCIAFHCYFAINLTAVIYMNSGYLIIMSTIIKLKFHRMKQILKQYLGEWRRARTRRQWWMWRYMMLHISAQLRLVTHIRRQVLHFNIFWKHMLTISIIWRFLIINFLAYIVFFYKLRQLVRNQYILMLLTESGALALTIGIISNTSNSSLETSRLLYKIVFSAPQQVHSISFKLKTQSFIEFLQDPNNFGIRMANNRLITRSFMVTLIREITTFFFLFASLSLRITQSSKYL